MPTDVQQRASELYSDIVEGFCHENQPPAPGAEGKEAALVAAGEEESRDDITMDTTDLDYSIITEQGRLLLALQPVEEQAYSL